MQFNVILFNCLINMFYLLYMSVFVYEYLKKKNCFFFVNQQCTLHVNRIEIKMTLFLFLFSNDMTAV